MKNEMNPAKGAAPVDQASVDSLGDSPTNSPVDSPIDSVEDPSTKRKLSVTPKTQTQNTGATSSTFEGIREVVVAVDDKAEGRHQILDGVQFACQPGGELHSGEACKHCHRFVNWRPHTSPNQISIRCLWTEDDPVTDLMARRDTCLVLQADTPLKTAATMVQEHDAPHILVEYGRRFIGVVHRAQLESSSNAAADETLFTAVRPARAIASDKANLYDIVATLLVCRLDWLPVVNEEDHLVGTIDQQQLREAGLDPALLTMNH